MNPAEKEIWLLRYLDEHCESPDQAGFITVDRNWKTPGEAKTDHAKAIASGLNITCGHLEGIVSRLTQLDLMGRKGTFGSLHLWITPEGQDAVQTAERDPHAVRNEILQTVLEIQGASRNGVDDTTIADRPGLTVDEVRGHLSILDEEGRIRLSQTMYGHSAFLQPGQRQKVKELALIHSASHESVKVLTTAFSFHAPRSGRLTSGV